MCEFSVVIPSRDRPAQLKRCLAALSAIEPPAGGFEVIVVDDGSRAPYAPGEFPRDLPIRWLRRDGGGPGQARNAGVVEALGTFVALTDDDCAPAADWLARLGAALRRRPDALVGGRTINSLPENAFAQASHLLLDYLYDYYGDTNANRFFASCNFALRRDLYLELGGFSPRFRLAGGEDRDFCARWTASGRSLTFAPDAVVHHAHSLTPRGFVRQHFTYGRGAWHFHCARAARGEGQMRIEPPGFYAGMLRTPFGKARRPLWVSGLIAASVALNAAGYFRERWTSRLQRDPN